MIKCLPPYHTQESANFIKPNTFMTLCLQGATWVCLLSWISCTNWVTCRIIFVYIYWTRNKHNDMKRNLSISLYFWGLFQNFTPWGKELARLSKDDYLNLWVNRISLRKVNFFIMQSQQLKTLHVCDLISNSSRPVERSRIARGFIHYLFIEYLYTNT